MCRKTGALPEDFIGIKEMLDKKFLGFVQWQGKKVSEMATPFYLALVSILLPTTVFTAGNVTVRASSSLCPLQVLRSKSYTNYLVQRYFCSNIGSDLCYRYTSVHKLHILSSNWTWCNCIFSGAIAYFHLIYVGQTWQELKRSISVPNEPFQNLVMCSKT